MMFRCIFLLFLASASIVEAFKKIKGRLLCEGRIQKGVNVVLMEGDRTYLEPNEYIDHMKTDKAGTFELFTLIEEMRPEYYIVIHHTCSFHSECESVLHIGQTRHSYFNLHDIELGRLKCNRRNHYHEGPYYKKMISGKKLVEEEKKLVGTEKLVKDFRKMLSGH